MTKPVTITWPSSNTTYVAPLQTLSAAGSLTLKTPIVYFPGTYRELTFTSTNDLAGVTFTVNGTIAGLEVSASIAGPNDNTVTLTSQLFDSVTSITTSAAAAAVSVGIGGDGFTAPWFYDVNATVAAVSVSVTVAGTAGNVTPIFAASLQEFYPPLGNQLTLTGLGGDSSNTNPAIGPIYGIVMPQLSPNAIGANTPGVSSESLSYVLCFAGEALGTNSDVLATPVIATFKQPIRFATFIMEESTSPAFVGTVYITFLQQGIR